jgi:hypothetical protein
MDIKALSVPVSGRTFSRAVRPSMEHVPVELTHQRPLMTLMTGHDHHKASGPRERLSFGQSVNKPINLI